MRILITIGCILLIGPVVEHKASADLYSKYGYSDSDAFYFPEDGSGDGPELEGSGHGHLTPKGSYDYTDDTEDGTDDDLDDWGNVDVIVREEEEEIVVEEGSGTGIIFDIEKEEEEEETVFIPEEPEVVVKERYPVEVGAVPAATEPTLTDSHGMDSVQIHTTKTEDRQVSIFAQPGILAAFIGGAVVGLLCAILLVMFIVYRMRKKDEGSYPLDEPKRMPLTSSYSPNDKEIYA